MERNTSNKDVLDSLDIYSYIAELLAIPLGGPTKLNGKTRSSLASVRAKEFSQYRTLCKNEACTRRRLTELLAKAARAEKNDSPQLPLLRAEIRSETLNLADLTLRRRRLEDRRDHLKGLAKMVVQYRYFDKPDCRVPSWGDTAAHLGIALSGDELRRYVCSKFLALK
ncbi:MAG: hypothetical protein J5582_01755 [Ruminococcus sp.]|uniref:hypothetical protein n=1 Tax=Ruminococcus sp. TaxID=41978 RepID=UPI0025D3B950|nr:hypothetical protein [Ruminococcus sp.]MBO4865284.1 hypothetical protein [Ruminococcus sp.]